MTSYNEAPFEFGSSTHSSRATEFNINSLIPFNNTSPISTDESFMENIVSVFPRRVRKRYSLNKTTQKPWSPTVAKNVPQNLKTILPNQTFFEPSSQPGIYIIYFPKNNSVYIGQSKKINHEIRQIKRPGSLANRPNLKYYFDASGLENVKFYALSQGPDFENRKIRLQEEDKFIKKAGSYSINITGKISPKSIIRFSSDPNVIQPIFIERKIPWQKDPLGDLSNPNLNFPILPENSSQSCLYIIKNKKTGNFYIGQSENCKILLRVHKHRSLIRKTQYWQLRGVKTAESITYQSMISDMKEGGNVFEYAIFEYLNNLNTRDRIDREINVIAEAYFIYGNRVYNNLTPKIQKIISKFCELGRTFNTTKTKIICLL